MARKKDKTEGKPKSRARRRFLIGGTVAAGGLFVGWQLLGGDGPADPVALMKPGADEAALNAWVKIAADGTVTVAVPRSEMGQGIHTALPMILAEELDADFGKIRVINAEIDKVYVNDIMVPEGFPFGPHDDGFMARQGREMGRWLSRLIGVQATGGSTSVRAGWQPMREAGAMAREMLKQAAASQLGVSPASLKTEAGEVVDPVSGRRIGYGVLAAAAAGIKLNAIPALRDPSEFRIIGQPQQRLDIPAKVDGTAIFGIDVRLPDMLFAAVKHPPVVGATVKQFDPAQVQRMPGVVKTIAVPGGVAVIADSTWRAKKAVEALDVTYDAGETPDFSSEGLFQTYEAALAESGFGYQDDGDAEATLETAGSNVIELTYRAPFLAHATMEPINCTARLDGNKLELWAPTQGPMVSQWIAAGEADLDTENVTVNVTYLGGGFGRRAEPDFIRQAVACAMAVPGRGVQVVWSREEDMRQDTYRPATLAHFRISTDDAGQPTAWANKLVGPSVSGQATMRYISMATDSGPDRTSVDGAAWLPYAIPDMRVEHILSRVPVRVGFWRSVGHSQNAFYSEAVIDELAHAAGKDPYVYRMGLLADNPRYANVLQTAARMADWETGAPEGRARGIALHESFGAIVAQVVEVSLQGGQPRVHKVWCAIDAGIVINPDTIVAQMESGIVYGLSAALFGEITFENGEPQQSNFPDYEVITLANMPVIETRIIASTEAPGGAGEPGTPPIAPAVTSALFALTGQRIRELPVSRHDWSGFGT
ncbi:MAG: xanthine dehydrogenase family protein molybdopterin-binding subunit [Minwuia sp.]|nr:xanthine dehydrogenase family protein molybdopterin-binding subunit [Minwuia sp.]